MRNRARNLLVAAAGLAVGFSAAPAQEIRHDGAVALAGDGALPRPVRPRHFAALMANSPFTRSLNLSESLILTGVAMVDGKQVATLMNRQTKETYVVSDQPNIQGWKMVEYAGNEDLEKVAAKITVTGGEVVTVRYDDWSLKPGEARPAGGGSGGEIRGRERRFGSRGDGKGRGPFGGGPPPEIRERMMKLPEDQRRKLFEGMMKLRRENPDMSWEKRGEIMRKQLEKFERSK